MSRALLVVMAIIISIMYHHFQVIVDELEGFMGPSEISKFNSFIISLQVNTGHERGLSQGYTESLLGHFIDCELEFGKKVGSRRIPCRL